MDKWIYKESVTMLLIDVRLYGNICNILNEFEAMRRRCLLVRQWNVPLQSV